MFYDYSLIWRHIWYDFSCLKQSFEVLSPAQRNVLYSSISQLLVVYTKNETRKLLLLTAR